MGSVEEQGLQALLTPINGGAEAAAAGSIRMVLFSTSIAVCGSFVYGSSLGYSSPTQEAIISDHSLSIAQFSVFGSILSLGAMLGALLSGRIADFIGRKGAMRISSIICIGGWLAIIFSEFAWSLYLGRIALGFGVGIYSYVVPVYIAEITPQNIRGGLTTTNQLMVTCGISFVYVVGTLVSWRALASIGTIPCIVQLIGLLFVPESPRWMAKFGEEKKFKLALQNLRGKDADISQEASDIQALTERLAKLPKAKWKDLFQKNYMPSVIVGVALMIFQQLGGASAVVTYSSSIFESAGFTSGSVGTLALAGIQVPLSFLGAILLDKLGRRPLLIFSAGGSCLGCLIASMSFIFKSHAWLTKLVPAINLTGILVLMASFALGMSSIPWVIMSEIYPINMKGMAGSLVTFTCWSCAWLLTYTFNYLFSWSAAGTFIIYSGISGLAVLFIAKLVPETKGRTLEEIQEAMNYTQLRS